VSFWSLAQVKQVIEQPQPAEFFRLFGVDTTMQGVAARLHTAQLSCRFQVIKYLTELSSLEGV
jgi:hypothetical protein